MTVKASWNIDKFMSTMYGTIVEDYDILRTLEKDFELLECYSSDFDYNDGEEGANGEIYYYFQGELVLTHVIYGGDDEDFKFTELGKTMFKELLFNYITLLLNK